MEVRLLPPEPDRAATGDHRRGEIAITNRGKSIGTWGEGLSYDGPGRVWFNRQT